MVNKATSPSSRNSLPLSKTTARNNAATRARAHVCRCVCARARGWKETWKPALVATRTRLFRGFHASFTSANLRRKSKKSRTYNARRETLELVLRVPGGRIAWQTNICGAKGREGGKIYTRWPGYHSVVKSLLPPLTSAKSFKRHNAPTPTPPTPTSPTSPRRVPSEKAFRGATLRVKSTNGNRVMES